MEEATIENALEFEDFQPEEKIELNEAWLKRAKVELNEDPKKLESELKDLKQYLEINDNFKNIYKNDKFLVKFLRAKSHDVTKAVDMIYRYFTARCKFKSNFQKSLPSASRDIFHHQIQTVLSHRDTKARRVFIFRVGKWNTKSVSKEDVFSANYLCLELMAREERTQVSGITAIVDMHGMSWSHWKQMSMEYIQSMVGMVQNSFPIRFREIHIVNESTIFNVAYSLVKPFLTDKMKGRLRFHGNNLSSLHSCVPALILPQELGGDMGKFTNQRVVTALAEMEEFFVLLHNMSHN